MKLYAFVDARHPNLNLVIVTTEDPNLLLERVELDVEDENSDVIAAVKAKLDITE